MPAGRLPPDARSTGTSPSTRWRTSSSDCEARALVVDAEIPPAGHAGDARAAPRSTRAHRRAARSTVGEQYAAALADATCGSARPTPSPGTLMLYTSGTTGRPKGVRKRPHPAGGREHRGLRRRERPPLHRPAVPRGPVEHLADQPALERRRRRPDGSLDRRRDAASSSSSTAVTHTHMVPTMFHRMLALDDATRAAHDLSSLRLVVHGAAPVPDPREAGDDRVGRPGARRVLRVHRGRGHAVDAGDVAAASRAPSASRTPRTRCSSATRTRSRSRPARSAWSGSRATRARSSSTSATRTRPSAASAAPGTRSATSATSTTTATCSSPVAAPSSSSPAA